MPKKFDSEVVDTGEWQGERLVWCPWNLHEPKPLNIINLKFEGDDLEVRSFKIANCEHLIFDVVKLSTFQNNLAFYHSVQPGMMISLEIKISRRTQRTRIWWELEQ